MSLSTQLRRTLIAGAVLLLSACGNQPARLAANADSEAFVDSSFTPLSAGFERMPAVGATYADADLQIGAEPQWNPQKIAHIGIATRAARGPSSSQRDVTRLAYLLSLRGDLKGADEALARAKASHPDAGGVYWSEGWIRMNMADYEGALVAWQVAEKLHGGQPYWVPYSKAIALVGMGDSEAALAWWQIARASHAPRLNSAAQALAHFQHWREAERALLNQLVKIAYPAPQPVSP